MLFENTSVAFTR